MTEPRKITADAMPRVVETEAAFRAFLQEGLDAVERGDVVPHAQVMAELDAMIARHRARCR
ncbi:hypothetical protein CA233_17025 [Sphingomonas sp. ABOLD]|uniref:Putative transcriptional regulator n=1 Tax=Sphingomonas trueperi TaxID=53317 RepID=A0A7X5XW29_9SPHN|nr:MULTISPECIES: hypothetical protein [Sphingomonas]NJB96055.1 putative transcriptional regulator [Sphingomonas trueperi]RSV42758.1 hypothetical protein CA233_17025 [Sphingomonas sp. ABOLD]